MSPVIYPCKAIVNVQTRLEQFLYSSGGYISVIA